jgi:hypothetical protein
VGGGDHADVSAAWRRESASGIHRVTSMNLDVPHVSREREILGYIGAVLLLLIIPIKLLRFTSAAGSLVIGVAPSVLGPSGLLFLLLSRPGWWPGRTLARATLVAAVISAGLELIQLVPRPGVLSHVRYTFDVLDLVATLAAVGVSAVIAGWVLDGRGHGRERGAGETG